MSQTPLTLTQVKVTDIVWIELIPECDVFPALLNNTSNYYCSYKRPKARNIDLWFKDYGYTWRAWEYEPLGEDLAEAT